MSNAELGRHNQNYGATIFGALAVFGFLILLYPLAYLSGFQDGYRRRDFVEYRNIAQSDARNSCTQKLESEMFDCIYNIVDDNQSKTISSQDLLYQKNAASAAMASALISFLTLIVTAVGVLLVKRTLDATWAAVQDTSKATSAMLAANEIARDTSERQLRAYISVGKVYSDNVCNPHVLKKLIQIPLVNSGPTPVENWRIEWCWQIEEVQGGGAYLKVLNKFKNTQAVNKKSESIFSFGPNQTKIFPVEAEINAAFMGNILDKDSHLFIIGSIFYTDVFAKERRTDFFYQLNVDGPTQFGQLPVHNKAT